MAHLLFESSVGLGGALGPLARPPFPFDPALLLRPERRQLVPPREKAPPPREGKVLCVVGTRPEAIKMAPVINAVRQRPGIECRVLATAQHRELLDQVLD